MRNNDIVADNTLRDVGGKQSFTVADDEGKRSFIPLKFNVDIMTVACLEPTNEEPYWR